MHRLRTLSVAAILAVALPVLAADDHNQDHDARHGGIVTESGHHHLEIVATDGTLEVYIGGVHGTRDMVSKAKATAAVLSDGKKVDVELAPGDGSVLKGSGPFKAGPGTIVILTLTMPEHDPEQIRVKLK